LKISLPIRTSKGSKNISRNSYNGSKARHDKIKTRFTSLDHVQYFIGMPSKIPVDNKLLTFVGNLLEVFLVGFGFGSMFLTTVSFLALCF
jgi:hypothetical protein